MTANISIETPCQSGTNTSTASNCLGITKQCDCRQLKSVLTPLARCGQWPIKGARCWLIGSIVHRPSLPLASVSLPPSRDANLPEHTGLNYRRQLAASPRRSQRASSHLDDRKLRPFPRLQLALWAHVAIGAHCTEDAPLWLPEQAVLDSIDGRRAHTSARAIEHTESSAELNSGQTPSVIGVVVDHPDLAPPKRSSQPRALTFAAAVALRRLRHEKCLCFFSSEARLLSAGVHM
jgi:hypothetical protein